MRSTSHLVPAALSALLLAGCAMARTDTAAATPLSAPSPQEVAARAAAGQRTVIHQPDGTTRVVGAAAGGEAVSTGTAIAVPATARVNTLPPAEMAAAATDGAYDAPAYEGTDDFDPYASYIDSPTVVEYETLIRAGGPPGYSITTLHGGPLYRGGLYPTVYGDYGPYYSRPYSYHYDRYSLDRSDRHLRPYSSRIIGGASPYDPLGSALHRNAVLRFDRASYPRNLDGRDRSHGGRDADRGRADGGRRDADRGGSRGNDRRGYRRDSGARDGGSRPSRGGAARSPK